MRHEERMNQTGGAYPDRPRGVWRWVFSPVSFALKHPYFTAAFLLIVGSELLAFVRAHIVITDIRPLVFWGGLVFFGYVLVGICCLGGGRECLLSKDGGTERDPIEGKKPIHDPFPAYMHISDPSHPLYPW